MDRVGPFELGRRIGAGGMGEVFEASHKEMRVAVKLVHSRLAERAASREGFRNEVRAVARLDHPAIVRVFDHGEHERRPYLVMELLSGACLDQELGRLPWEEARRCLFALLDALAHAHARGVIHRDIKPANVLLEEERVVLTDFGLAHALTEPGTSHIAGTPTYMSPEQFRGRWRDYGPWTDLYSLGVLAWELVCGRPPFPEDTLGTLRRAHLTEDPPPLAACGPVPEGLGEWLEQLLTKDPRQRFQRAADAAWALHALGEPTEHPTLVPPAPPTRRTFLSMPTGPALTWMGGTLVPETTLDQQVVEPTAVPALGPPPPPSELPGTWRVEESTGPRLLPSAGLGLVGLRQARLVGRQAARDRIWAALRQGADGPRAFLLRGPAGVGKSRLAEWMCERAHEVGAAEVFRASFGPDASVEHGLRAMIRRHFRLEGLDGEALLARLTAAGQDPELLGPLLQGGGLSRAERFGALRQALAGPRTALVWLDDVHWSPDALDFAASVLRDPHCEALLLLTLRDEALAQEELASERIAALSGLGAETLSLRALDRREQRELVRDLLGLAGELADEVEARSDGNPLFAVELVHELVDRGALEQGPGGFRLRPGERAELSDDLRQVWAHRLDELLSRGSPGEAGFLRMAAALGGVVVDEEWEAVCRLGGARGVSPPVDWEDVPGLDPPLAALRETLVEARLATRTSPSSWSFAHGMLREALGPTAQDHRVCAEALAGQDERVARHLLSARQWEEALPPLDRAVADHRIRGSFAEAHRLLYRKAEALRALGVPSEAGVWADLLSARATMHRLVGDFERFETESLEAERRARASGASLALAHVLRGRGETRRQRGRMEEAEQAFREALPLLRGRDPYEEAECWRGLGDVLRQTRRFAEARRAYEEGVRASDERSLPASLRGLASLALRDGDVPRSRALLLEAEQGFAAIGARIGQANCLNDLGDLERMSGRHREAERAYGRALAFYRLHGAYADIWPRVNLGLLRLQVGREGLRPWFEEILRDVRRVGIPSLEAGVHVALALVAGREGGWSRAAGHLGDAATLLTDTGDADQDNVWPLEQLAELALAAGQDTLAARAASVAAEQRAMLGEGFTEASPR